MIIKLIQKKKTVKKYILNSLQIYNKNNCLYFAIFIIFFIHSSHILGNSTLKYILLSSHVIKTEASPDTIISMWIQFNA